MKISSIKWQNILFIFLSFLVAIVAYGDILKPVNDLNPIVKAASMHLDTIAQNTNGEIAVKGWAFIKGQDAEKTKKYLILSSDKKKYIFPLTPVERTDVTKAFNLGQNSNLSGFDGIIPKGTVTPGTYEVQLYLQINNAGALEILNNGFIVS